MSAIQTFENLFFLTTKPILSQTQQSSTVVSSKLACTFQLAYEVIEVFHVIWIYRVLFGNTRVGFLLDVYQFLGAENTPCTSEALFLNVIAHKNLDNCCNPWGLQCKKE